MGHTMPRCGKCKQRHYNFQGCADAADQQRRERNSSLPVLRPRENDWGNRTISYVQLAPGVIGVRRAPLHSATRPGKDAA